MSNPWSPSIHLLSFSLSHAESPPTLKVTWMRAASALALHEEAGCQLHHVSWEEASPQILLLWSAGQFLAGVTFVKELFSFSDRGGSSLSPLSFTILHPQRSYSPKFLRAFPVCPPTVQRFPRALPSTLTECSTTPDDHSVHRKRGRAASKKIGSSADSKIKSSQSMKSALVTLHT